MTTTELEQGAMTAKVRIDLSAGVLEAEGSEEFIRELYEDFRERFGAKVGQFAPESGASGNGAADGIDKPPKPKPERKSGPSTAVRSRTPVLVKDLDLATKGTRVGLRDFVKRYRKLTSAQEWNSVFVYYLALEAEQKPITMDHVFTCYKHVPTRPPDVLTQSLRDTARLKGTIDAASLDDIKLTPVGENWVEHDLDKAEPEPAVTS